MLTGLEGNFGREMDAHRGLGSIRRSAQPASLALEGRHGHWDVVRGRQEWGHPEEMRAKSLGI
jgi:hypothetical protein